jgi:toxin-antitoxin system PIN domain toxin
VTLPDVNVLLSAHREDSEHHGVCHGWLLETMKGEAPFGLSELVLASVVRLATHPKIFRHPTRLDVALAFIAGLLQQPNAIVVRPGPGHWGIFSRLCREADTRGNLVTDAYLAALAIEAGCEWVTLDGDFARFRGLKWRRPLETA